MTSTIITKNSSTASGVPLAADLTQGELAVNVTDKKLYSKDSGGSVVKLVGSLGNQEANAVAITGGAVNGTTIGATTASTGAFTTLAASSSVTLSGGTANGVTYLNGSKVLTSGSALTFDGTNLGLGVTPSASSACVNMELSAYGATLSARNTSSAPQFAMMSNAVGNWYAPTYKINGKAAMYLAQGNDGSHSWYTAGTGTAGTAISFTQAMTLDASGNLGVGTTSPSVRVHAMSSSSSLSFGLSPSSSNTNIGYITNDSTYIMFASGYGTTGQKFRVALQAPDNSATIDSSGNLGLGVTPSAWNTFKAIDISNIGSVAAYPTFDLGLYRNCYYDGSVYRYKITDEATYYAQDAAGKHAWYTAASGTAGDAISFTQAMTLDASGSLLVGTTAMPSASSGGAGFEPSSNGRTTLKLGTTSTTSLTLQSFWNPNGAVGAISTSGSTTTYSTSSDYRLKNTIAPMTGALAKVAQLKPVTYKWNADGSDGEGFIAHELAEVVPQCVTGEKDAVDEEGNPKYQGIDTSFLVATVVAALQELKAEFDAYKASHP